MRDCPRSFVAAFTFVAMLLVSPEMTRGAELQVPGEYATIASAIGAASNGDTILIAAGTYAPAETIDPDGKSITLRGAIDGEGFPATIIDGQGSIRVLLCSNGPIL